jgi:hypothetical protein
LPSVILLVQKKQLLRRKPEYLTLITGIAVAHVHVVRTRSKTSRRMQSTIGFSETLDWIAITKAYSYLLQDIVRQVCVQEKAEILVAIAGRH